MATVDEVSGGRAILGLGVGDRPLRALGLHSSSVDALEAAVGSIRRLWRGDEITSESASFRFRDAHLRFQPRPTSRSSCRRADRARSSSLDGSPTE